MQSHQWGQGLQEAPAGPDLLPAPQTSLETYTSPSCGEPQLEWTVGTQPHHSRVWPVSLSPTQKGSYQDKELAA